MKKVLLIVIDSATGWVFERALAEDRLPNFAALVDAGEIRYDSVAVFPSITPAATSSIATGRYPVEHGIAGNYWFDADDNSLVYYGSDIPAILNHGLGSYFEDFLVSFNHHRLSAPTIFHTVEAAGRISACLNFLIFNGPHPHDVVVPPLVEILPGVELSKTVYGPTILSLGVLVKPQLPNADEPLDVLDGPLHKFGFDDENSAVLLRQMLEQRALPDFTLAYFPDYDGACHAQGPWDALPTLEKIDGFLGELFAAHGGLDALLADVCIALSGDHAQCDIVDDDSAGILLNDLLPGFTVAKAGVTADQMNDDDDLIVCPNLRLAQLYVREPAADRCANRDELADLLLADARIDQAFWRTQDDDRRWIYHVSTRPGNLQFGAPPRTKIAPPTSTAAAGSGRAICAPSTVM
ncbi:MAG: alkaline phosphatase family protein [Caldilineaceae bacterium]